MNTFNDLVERFVAFEEYTWEVDQWSKSIIEEYVRDSMQLLWFHRYLNLSIEQIEEYDWFPTIATQAFATYFLDQTCN